jgi:autotransporter-associated beta strand protein
LGGVLSSAATGTRTFTFQGNGDTEVFGVIANGSATTVNVTKLGAGRLILSGTNTHTGATTLNAGSLLVNGVISSVSVTAGTLGGNGMIGGAPIIPAGATLSPGTSVGALSFSNSLSLSAGSTTFMEISKAPLTNDQVRAGTTLTYGGTLSVTNLDGPLTAGDNFKLFQATTFNGSFTATNLPPLDTGLGWRFTATNGTLSVIQTVALNPTNITASVSGDTLTLLWPADHLGWRLETNAVDISDSDSWFTLAGSADTNQVFLTIDPNLPNVFFRLRYP